MDRKINVVYICYSYKTVGGAALSLVNLLHSIKEYVNPIVITNDHEAGYNLFASEGFETINVPFEQSFHRGKYKWKQYIKYPLTIYKVRKANNIAVNKIFEVLKDRNISLVHSNNSLVRIGTALSKLLGCKHIWHIREFLDIDFDYRPIDGYFLFRKQLSKSDGVIAITKAVYNHFQLFKHPKSFYIWDAVRSKEDLYYSLSRDKFLFFCAAQISPAKGLDVGIEAFALSGIANEGYKLIVAGELLGTVKDEIDFLISKYNLQESIDFIGFCGNIIPYMQKAKAFLMCSKNEGLGRVTIEAMFNACPVIGFASSGTLEVIEDKVTGFLFADTEECSNLIKHVIASDNKTVVDNAAQLATKKFAEEEYGIKIIEAYESVLGVPIKDLPAYS